MTVLNKRPFARTALAGAWLALLAGPVSAQDSAMAEYAANSGEALTLIAAEGDVFGAYVAAASIPVGDEADAALAAGQQVATVMAIAGEEDAAIAAMTANLDAAARQMRQGQPDPGARPEPSGITPARAADAIAEIRERARNHQIVMLNEAHYVPGQRAFAERLFAALLEDGFTVLAMETLPAAEGDFEPPVTYSDHIYSNDPRFAGIIETFIAGGGSVRGYSPTQEQRESGAGREQLALEAVTALRAAAPNGKLLIYCGGQHASEQPGWLAGMLKEQAGIDPLTIDQTSGTPHPPGTVLGNLWRGLAEDARPDAPSVFFLENGAPYSNRTMGVFDLMVVHPELEPTHGRPGWWRFMEDYEAVALEGRNLPAARPLMIEARPSGSNPAAVPADRLVIQPDEASPVLFLKAGAYEVLAIGADGAVEIGDITAPPAP